MEELILALFMPSTYYDAWSLRKAMQVLYLISITILHFLIYKASQILIILNL